MALRKCSLAMLFVLLGVNPLTSQDAELNQQDPPPAFQAAVDRARRSNMISHTLSPMVARQLKLSNEQRERIQRMIVNTRKKFKAAVHELRDMDPAIRQNLISAARDTLAAENQELLVSEVLKPAQVKVMQDWMLFYRVRVGGVSTVVGDILPGVSPEKIREITQLESAEMQRLKMEESRLYEEVAKKIAKLRAEALEKTLTPLNEVEQGIVQDRIESLQNQFMQPGLSLGQ